MNLPLLRRTGLALGLAVAAYAQSAIPQAVWEQKLGEADQLRKRAAYNDALQTLETALLLADAQGQDNYYVGRTLVRIAGVHLDRGEFQRAEPILVRALRILQTVKGPEDLSVAECLDNLGVSRRNQGRYQEAEGNLLQALAIGRKVAGPVSREAAASLFAIGLLYQETGRNDHAIRSLREALQVSLKTGADAEHLAAIQLGLETPT